MLTWLSIGAGVVIALLGWNLYRRFASDRLTELSEHRRSSSRLVGPGQFIDGNRRLDVALAVSGSTFFYENTDMQASLDLDRVREIEYDTELATGGPIGDGAVLRLRSDSQTFEFILPKEQAPRWEAVLPPRSGGSVHSPSAERALAR